MCGNNKIGTLCDFSIIVCLCEHIINYFVLGLHFSLNIQTTGEASSARSWKTHGCSVITSPTAKSPKIPSCFAKTEPKKPKVINYNCKKKRKVKHFTAKRTFRAFCFFKVWAHLSARKCFSHSRKEATKKLPIHVSLLPLVKYFISNRGRYHYSILYRFSLCRDSTYHIKKSSTHQAQGFTAESLIGNEGKNRHTGKTHVACDLWPRAPLCYITILKTRQNISFEIKVTQDWHDNAACQFLGFKIISPRVPPHSQIVFYSLPHISCWEPHLMTRLQS